MQKRHSTVDVVAAGGFLSARALARTDFSACAKPKVLWEAATMPFPRAEKQRGICGQRCPVCGLLCLLLVLIGGCGSTCGQGAARGVDWHGCDLRKARQGGANAISYLLSAICGRLRIFPTVIIRNEMELVTRADCAAGRYRWPRVSLPSSTSGMRCAPTAPTARPGRRRKSLSISGTYPGRILTRGWLQRLCFY